MPNVTKKDIARTVAINCNMEACAAEKAVQCILDTLCNSMQQVGTRIELRGFGIFETKMRKGHIARNMKDNSPMKLPDHLHVSFRCTDKRLAMPKRLASLGNHGISNF